MSNDQLPPCPVPGCGAEVDWMYWNTNDRRTAKMVQCSKEPGCQYRNWLNSHRALCAAVDAGKRVPELEAEISRLRANCKAADAIADAVIDGRASNRVFALQQLRRELVKGKFDEQCQEAP